MTLYRSQVILDKKKPRYVKNLPLSDCCLFPQSFKNTPGQGSSSQGLFERAWIPLIFTLNYRKRKLHLSSKGETGQPTSHPHLTGRPTSYSRTWGWGLGIHFLRSNNQTAPSCDFLFLAGSKSPHRQPFPRSHSSTE